MKANSLTIIKKRAENQRKQYISHCRIRICYGDNMASDYSNETKIGMIGRMKLARQISLNKIEPAYKDAIRIFGKKLSEKGKADLLENMKGRTFFSKWSKIIRYDLAQVGIGAGIVAAGSGSLASCMLGIPLSAYGVFGLTKSIASFNYSCYFPRPVHRVCLTYSDKESAFHEAVHFMDGEEIIKNHDAVEGIAIAASMLYDGGEEFLKKLKEDIERMNPMAGLLVNSHYKNMDIVNMISDIRNKTGTEAAWDYLYFMAE